MNTFSAATMKLNNKSLITIDLKNVEKLQNHNSLNCALMKEATEIIMVESEICNGNRQQLTIYCDTF